MCKLYELKLNAIEDLEYRLEFDEATDEDDLFSIIYEVTENLIPEYDIDIYEVAICRP